MSSLLWIKPFFEPVQEEKYDVTGEIGKDTSTNETFNFVGTDEIVRVNDMLNRGLTINKCLAIVILVLCVIIDVIN